MCNKSNISTDTQVGIPENTIIEKNNSYLVLHGMKSGNVVLQ